MQWFEPSTKTLTTVELPENPLKSTRNPKTTETEQPKRHHAFIKQTSNKPQNLNQLKTKSYTTIKINSNKLWAKVCPGAIYGHDIYIYENTCIYVYTYIYIYIYTYIHKL